MSSSKKSVSKQFKQRYRAFTKRHKDQTNANVSVMLREYQIEIMFSTPDNEGYLVWEVPLPRSLLERYLNPAVFVTLIQQHYSLEPSFGGHNRRSDIEQEEEQWRRECREKAKPNKN